MLKLKVAFWIRTVLDRFEAGLGLFRGGRKLSCRKLSESRTGRERQDPSVDALAVIIRTMQEPVSDRDDPNPAFIRFCRIRLLTDEDETSDTSHWLELDQKSRHRK